LKTRHKRIALIVGGLAILAPSSPWCSTPSSSNLVFFFSPTAGRGRRRRPPGKTFRIGGMVKEGSIKREADGVTCASSSPIPRRTSSLPTRASCPTCSRKGKAPSPRANSARMAFRCQ
jgi:cytochrome c-type biogenesis protein CcmE